MITMITVITMITSTTICARLGKYGSDLFGKAPSLTDEIGTPDPD